MVWISIVLNHICNLQHIHCPTLFQSTGHKIISVHLHVCVLYLQQTDSNRQCNTSGAEWSFALGDRPRVSLELAE